MTTPPQAPHDEDDPTGMRQVLHSLPDPGPMPPDLVARITAALEAERRDTVVIPLIQRPRRVWPRYAAAAAVASVALAGGVAVINVLQHGSADSMTAGATIQAESTTGGQQDQAASSPKAPVASDSNATRDTAYSAAAQTSVHISNRSYAAQTLALQAAATVANPGPTTLPLVGESPSVGPIATPIGARDCASALGVPTSSAVVADLGTTEGEAVALIVATDEGVARTAYLVKRSCHSGHPGIIAGPVALAAS